MKKVITYGTFDLFHQGHYNLLKRAKELGDYLIVGVTTEHFDEARGKVNVIDAIMDRIENVKKTGFADMIIVEDHDGYTPMSASSTHAKPVLLMKLSLKIMMDRRLKISRSMGWTYSHLVPTG